MNIVKVEVVRQREMNVIRKEMENFSVLANIARFVVEVVTTRRLETIAAMMATRVGMRVVDIEIQMTIDRIAEDRDAMTIPARVRPILMVAVDADVDADVHLSLPNYFDLHYIHFASYRCLVSRLFLVALSSPGHQ